mmetsp:Transcript_30261/g.92508  ORF Transcript_30261/g.92508 Transcript_30261/m.92508 type:complete len:180 (+) Transcript_30261:28-567(+)|eukprot:scaffold301159_cov30-Tisochrysis_lutea.AAC.1
MQRCPGNALKECPASPLNRNARKHTDPWLSVVKKWNNHVQLCHAYTCHVWVCRQRENTVPPTTKRTRQPEQALATHASASRTAAASPSASALSHEPFRAVRVVMDLLLTGSSQQSTTALASLLLDAHAPVTPTAPSMELALPETFASPMPDSVHATTATSGRDAVPTEDSTMRAVLKEA